MDEMDDQTLIQAWVEHELIKDKTLRWATRYLNKKCLKEPETALRLIIGILNVDKSNKTLPGLAAGPLENLLVYHGKKLIRQVREEALKNDRFNHLLGGVWQNRIEDEVWEEIEKIRKNVW